MRFQKMNGAGNDFIILNNLDGALPEKVFPAIARRLCERRLSIGADGLMVVAAPRAGGDYRMLFFNADGSVGEMCGNGARCICRYGYEAGLAGETQRVETTAGLVTGRRIDRRRYEVRLNDPTVMKADYPVSWGGETYQGAYVELGSPGLPHAVIPCPGLAGKSNGELFALGEGLRHHSAYPRGANINFYDLAGRDRVVARTFERGVEDFTYACGTGAGATALVLTLLGKVSGRDVAIEMPGGTLSITVEQEDGRVTGLYLTGPTNRVCEGEITDEELTF